MKATYKKAIVLIILMGFIFSCAGNGSKTSGQMDTSEIVQANNAFGMKLVKVLMKGDKNQNVFISPLSIYTALTMTLNGAMGKTYEEMAEVLGVKGYGTKKINSLIKGLLQSLDALNPEVKLSIANSIWVDSGVKAREKFINDSKEYFNSEVKNLKLNAAAVRKINEWVSDKTENMITKLVSSLPASTKMVLLNAIFFHGKWKKPFNERLTSTRVFTMANGKKIRHPLMYQKGKYDYFENDDFQAVRLDYGENKKAGLTIVLPKKGKDVNNIYDELNNDGLESIKLKMKEGKIYIPKFKITYGVKSLTSELKKMGMRTPFTAGADFRNLINSRALFISDVLHKAVIDLNEKGTKAAAATAVMIEKTAARTDTFYFTADRPFIYFITDSKTGLILFMGIMHRPKL